MLWTPHQMLTVREGHVLGLQHRQWAMVSLYLLCWADGSARAAPGQGSTSTHATAHREVFIGLP